MESSGKEICNQFLIRKLSMYPAVWWTRSFVRSFVHSFIHSFIHWPLLGRPNQSLSHISKIRVNKWSATLKIHQKSFQNPSKTFPKPTFEKRCVQDTPQNLLLGHLERFWVNFWRAPGAAFWILDDFGPSKMVTKSKKNPQNALKNRRLKQTYLRTWFFIEFSLNL